MDYRTGLTGQWRCGVSILLSTVQALLGVMFSVLGAAKLPFGKGLPNGERMREEFERFGYTTWFLVFTGLFEMTGALLLLAGFFSPDLIALGALIIAVAMIGACVTRVRMKDPVREIIPGAVLLALSTWLIVARGSF